MTLIGGSAALQVFATGRRCIDACCGGTRRGGPAQLHPDQSRRSRRQCNDIHLAREHGVQHKQRRPGERQLFDCLAQRQRWSTHRPGCRQRDHRRMIDLSPSSNGSTTAIRQDQQLRAGAVHHGPRFRRAASPSCGHGEAERPTGPRPRLSPFFDGLGLNNGDRSWACSGFASWTPPPNGLGQYQSPPRHGAHAGPATAPAPA